MLTVFGHPHVRKLTMPVNVFPDALACVGQSNQPHAKAICQFDCDILAINCTPDFRPAIFSPLPAFYAEDKPHLRFGDSFAIGGERFILSTRPNMGQVDKFDVNFYTLRPVGKFAEQQVVGVGLVPDIQVDLHVFQRGLWEKIDHVAVALRGGC